MEIYQSLEHSFAIRYARPEYKKTSSDRAKYFPKLMGFAEATAFVRERNTEFDTQMKAAVPKVMAAYFIIRYYPPRKFGGAWDVGMDLTIQCMMLTKESLTEKEEKMLNEMGKASLKSLANQFNKQPFTETEYGYAKMPRTLGHRFWFWVVLYPSGGERQQDILQEAEENIPAASA